MESEEVFLSIIKFFFKLTIYWPILGIFYLGRWLYETIMEKKGEAASQRYEAEERQRETEREQERRSRNTLYAGPQQPDT